jgi:2-C-methyl-D-erythritol 4-phosphate cytidylyltransferase
VKISEMPQFSVILPAAGRSTRFGGPVSKLYQMLGGRPVLSWTLAAFAQREDVHEIVVASSDAAQVAECVAMLDERQRRKVRTCKGGTCRAESVRSAARVTSPSSEWLAVHDAARPLASQAMIDRTLKAALEFGAAAAALPVHLTIKEAHGPLPAMAQRTIPRQRLWAMQTPQVMRRDVLLEAFDACPIALAEVTDDVQLLELAGKPVWLVEGEERNLKITTAVDLQIAELLLKC